MGILYEWGERGRKVGTGKEGKRRGEKLGEKRKCKKARVKKRRVCRW